MRFIFLAILLCFSSIGLAQTWLGSVNSDWNNAANWSTSAVPGAGTNVTIDGSGAFQPELSGNVVIRDLDFSGGTLNLNGFTLEIRNGSFTGGTIEDGQIEAVNFTALQDMIFNGDISLMKIAGNVDDLNGGNIFNGPTTITNFDNTRLRFAVTDGDTFNSTLVINKNGTGGIEMAYNGTNTFANEITINNLTINNRISFGDGGGTSELQSGGLITSSFGIGTLIINNFTQLTASPNGNFNPSVFTINNSTLLGEIAVETTGTISVLGSNTFGSDVTLLSGGQFIMPDGGNTFNSLTGSTTFRRNTGGGVTWGGGNSFGDFTLTDNATSNLTWQGNNTFNGTVLVVNNSNNIMRFASIDGDNFLGTTHFINDGTSTMDIAWEGNTTFADEITIDNNGAGNMRFGGTGAQTGTSLLTNGGLVTNDFTNGTLTIRRFTQVDNVPNGSFSPETFRVETSTFRGNLNITSGGTIDFVGGSTFEGNNNFISGGTITMGIGGNTFSLPGNTTNITRNGGGNVTWGPGNSTGDFNLVDNADGNLTMQGSNTFNGDVSFTRNENRVLRLANLDGDTFLATSEFINNGTSVIDIAYRGTNTFADEITIDNNAGGQIRFGQLGGTTNLNSGGLVTNNFNSGNLDIREFTQVGNFPNGPFFPDSFRADDNDFEGDFSVTTSGTLDLRANNRFASNNNFIANGQLNLLGNSQFSTNAGTNSYFEKNGGGNVNWNGGNTFGTVEFVNNTNNRIRLAVNGIGDTFLSTSVFNNNGTSSIGIARTGNNTFADQITINNNSGGRFNLGIAGVITQSSGGLVTSNFSSGDLDIRNFTQSADFPNGPFNPDYFRSENNDFEGDFSVTTSGILDLRENNRFASNNTFIANGQLNLLGNSQFSTNAGTSSLFEKNGGGNVNWTGVNTFGTSTFTNNTNSIIRMANSVGGDTFTGPSTFNNNGTGNIEIARNGANLFALTITVNNSSTGTISFGINGGTSLLSAGGIQTAGFNSGTLDIRNFSQVTATPNGNFQPANFLAENVSFLGNFTVSTSSTASNSMTIRNGSRFARNNTFTSAGGIIMTGGDNRFSLIPGNQTTMTKNGDPNNDWVGTNRYGNFILINNGSGRIRMANSLGGDQFIGNVTFNQNGSGLIEPARNFNNTFQGNISTLGSANAITFGLGNGVVEIIGNTAQELTGDAANEPRINRLTMNTTGTLEVLVPLTIGNNMTLTEGIINNEENLITFIANSNVTGGSNASHVNGRIRKVGNTGFTYPFGNNGFYAPLTTTGFGGGGSSAFHFTGRYFNTDPSGSGFDRDSKVSSIGEVDACEYWEFARTNGTATPNITLSWSDDRTCPIVDHEEFIVVKWDGAQWIDLEGTNLTGDENAGTVRNNIIVPNFSPPVFTLGQSFRILPIELLSFDAFAINDREIKVSWSTVQEKDNAYFTINKSLDGQKWFPIGIVPGAGNSDEILFYEFLDENPVFGRQFYRLTQTDLDGTSETFKVVGVTLQNAGENIDYKVYPNPSNGEFNIMSLNHNMEEAEISIVNTAGLEVRNFKDISGRFFSNDLTGLPKGMYVVRIKENHVWRVKKLILH